MKAAFIETTAFTDWVSDYLPDDQLASLQNELMQNPEMGAVIPGCGGLRKVRVTDPGRGLGKRSGTRVIYLYVPDAKRFYLISIYGKGRKEDLSVAEKKVFTAFAKQIQQQARDALTRRKLS